MTKKSTPSSNPHELEESYREYFAVPETMDDNAQLSLAQPSPLEYVDSFTTCGVTEDLLFPEGK